MTWGGAAEDSGIKDGLLLSRELPDAVSWVGDGGSGWCPRRPQWEMPACSRARAGGADGEGGTSRGALCAPASAASGAAAAAAEERGQAFAHGALSVVLTLVLVKGKSRK